MSAEQKKYSLLYVEHDPLVFAQTAKLLSRLGFVLHVAENGHEGLRIWQKARPDLVITEIELPVMDGLEMIRQMRTADPAAQVIVMSRSRDASVLLAAFDLEVQHYLLKPVEESRLTAVLNRCTDNLRRRAESGQSRLIEEALGQGPVAVVIADPSGKIVYANPGYCGFVGCSKDEILGQELAVAEAGSRFPDLLNSIRAAFSQGREWKGAIPTSAGNAIAWRSLHIRPLRDLSGSVAHYVGISEDITESRQREDEVRKLNAELEYRLIQRKASLEASKQELDDFCDAVSHDLRGPLARLQGFTEVLQEECADTLDEQGKLFVGRITQACNELKPVIDALLNLSQLTRRGMACQTVDLGALARSVADNLQTRNPEREVEWLIAPSVMVSGDEGLLRIVLENLLGNALKCTSRAPRPRIEFGVARSGLRTLFFVRDNGIGFDQKYADKLFRPFQRLHSGEEVDGAGLGLAAVRRIIQRHNGRIWAEGEVGCGATFYFTLN